jgi:ParB/RepB/Spo0J family partition protein
MPDPLDPSTTDDAAVSVMLPVLAIEHNPWLPRRHRRRTDLDDRRLTASIARHGVIEPLVVRPKAENRFELIFGKRRLRCAKASGRTEVPAIIRALDDHEARVLSLTESLRHEPLHFLEEADAVAGLVDEHWTLGEIADELGKPLSWVSRRHRLLNLSRAWRKLAEAAQGWTASWSSADFEEIAILAPPAQDELLTRARPRLERCTGARELAQLVRSLTPIVSSFPWDPDDADLHSLAGACSDCPHRSSQHPGLFDDREPARPRLAGSLPKSKSSRGSASARCLDPVCATTKAQLFLDRRFAQLAAKHPEVLLLQEGWLQRDIPGTIHDYEVTEVDADTHGAIPALVANGANLGKVRWIKPPHPRGHPAPPPPSSPSPSESLAAREARTDRRRKIHAITLLKAALRRQPPPDLLTSVRLAIVFGTTQANTSAHVYGNALPCLAPGIDPKRERRRMLGCPADGSADPRTPFPASAQAALSAPLKETEPTAAAAATTPRDQERFDDRQEIAPAQPPDISSVSLLDRGDGAGRFWHAFHFLDGDQDACAYLLWSHTLRVMLDRMTPNGRPGHLEVAWNEAMQVADLVGLDAQIFLDQATAALPDPESRSLQTTHPPAAAGSAGPAGAVNARHQPPAPAEEPPEGTPLLKREGAQP